MLHTDYTPGRTVTQDGRSCLFFSGFAYLGLHQLPAFKHLLTQGIEKYGALFPSSRSANLRLSIYEEIEHALSSHLQQQSAAVFSSGYQASQAAAQYATSGKQPLYAPDAHPSLWHQQPELPVMSREEWIAQTIEKVNTHPDHHFVIITDTVNPLTATIHPFHWLQELQRKVLVLADDSHGIGILGPAGQGAIHFLPQTPFVRYLLTASLAKAYSVSGGVVAGHAADIMAIKRLPLFSASTPMIPAHAYAWLQSGELIAKMHRSLQQNIAYLLHLTANTAVHNPHGLPMFILPPGEALVQYLQDRDVIISSFPYPQPHSPVINRAVVSALHLQEDMTTLHRFLGEFGITKP
ncbi:pyridoxal phosphate-dependent aminotransferase family protein [Chitinophaga ginsengisegetis]|uniref:aminotransferase class I/II-fold pyridoxal phosphate-dependent enzyme n=1 Tax=Chitinophaga ginsengisegetis TaxID=393003 RepID=UPI000DC009DD|nr:aminotransferase class I/II-fold pyridoxal phosphate-dependent enzyme [Chitinophaga ginsengisegetis]MDR6570438.1 7-keto-8-aminopelargonate synthetase-like enzyme [Chitinophaga ginsengisegetis]MDR6650172.1 7-keto-8-aminopelargonate synthetase-like enzyme [Chitinophaga ginsengisegetis]MDR6656709.1 7-keto-8-aminopelargonate synthetase-like enzyme [Chitinophaga ginsengisegetis]